MTIRLPSSGANGPATTSTRAGQLLSPRMTFGVLLCLSMISYFQQMKSIHSTGISVSPVAVGTLTENINTPVINGNTIRAKEVTNSPVSSNNASTTLLPIEPKATDPPRVSSNNNANATLLPIEPAVFKRYDRVVIVTKIHGPHQWQLVEQSQCLLHHSYNHQLLYDIVIFTATEVPEKDIEDLQQAVAPAKLTVVMDNLGFQEEIAALTPLKRDLFFKRCGVTSPVNLTWWSECPGRVAYNWQAEFRSVRIWEHPALEKYRYMFWLDSDGFPSKPFEKDPVEYFIQNDAVIMFEHFPQGSDQGKYTQAIVNSFNATACDLRLGKNGHLERNLINREEYNILKAGKNKDETIKCRRTNIPMIHGFGHITDLDFYRQPKVINGLKGLLGNCFLCRRPDDQLAVTIPAAIYAPEKSLDMRQHGFNLRIVHNFNFDGQDGDKPKPPRFVNYWNQGGKKLMPSATVCKITQSA